MITRLNAFILLNIKTLELTLSDNKIVTIHPKAFWTSESNNTTPHTELKRLNLNNNNIKYIKSSTFDPLINLEHLALNNNKLRNIDNAFIVNLNKLDNFDIGNNELTHLPSKWLPTSLQSISISGNSIEYVSINTFEGAFNLSWINISPTNINIEFNSFSNLTKLTVIRVYTNDLEICTCKYIWYLNTKSKSTVCNNSNDKYASIREYLTEECKTQLSG